MNKEEFKANRKKLEMTQEQLADELRLSSRTIRAIEAGANTTDVVICSFEKLINEKNCRLCSQRNKLTMRKSPPII